MNDLREHVRHIYDLGRADGLRKTIFTPSQYDNMIDGITSDVKALLPKPTVRVKCQECDGRGNSQLFGTVDKVHYDPSTLERIKCPSCTDGYNEHEIVIDNDAGTVSIGEKV